jgi:hypothetical protein
MYVVWWKLFLLVERERERERPVEMEEFERAGSRKVWTIIGFLITCFTLWDVVSEQSCLVLLCGEEGRLSISSFIELVR